ncbi:hypothetical protein ABKN59_011473 [Abortiporus biennis]
MQTSFKLQPQHMQRSQAEKSTPVLFSCTASERFGFREGPLNSESRTWRHEEVWNHLFINCPVYKFNLYSFRRRTFLATGASDTRNSRLQEPCLTKKELTQYGVERAYGYGLYSKDTGVIQILLPFDHRTKQDASSVSIPTNGYVLIGPFLPVQRYSPRRNATKNKRNKFR